MPDWGRPRDASPAECGQAHRFEAETPPLNEQTRGYREEQDCYPASSATVGAERSATVGAETLPPRR